MQAAIVAGQDLNTVKSLLNETTDLTAQDADGNTALHLAAVKSTEDVIEFLLDNGADRNIANDFQQSPFLLALGYTRDLNIVKLLYKNSADLTVQDERGNTALHIAAARGAQDVVQFLINKGADRNALDKDGAIPFQVAIALARDFNIVQLLYNDTSDLTIRTGKGNTALHFAAMKAAADVVTFLLDKGADLKALDNQNRTPLMVAIIVGRHFNITKLLYHDTSDLTAQSTSGNTVLHLAAMDGTEDVVQFLLDKGADKRALGYRNRIPFLSALWASRDLNIIKLLYEDVSDLTARDDKGDTALHLATAGGAIIVAAFLLDKGADRKAPDNRHLTPFGLAILNHRQLDMIKLLFRDESDLTFADQNAAINYANSDVLNYLALKISSSSPFYNRIRNRLLNELFHH